MTESIEHEAKTATQPAAEVADRVAANLALAVHAPAETLRLPVLALLAEGHVLIEDVPGVGKTVLAKALARSVDLDFHRLQFTPDLLPGDVTGVSVFDQASATFRFRRGPVFTNVLLVDEVNRASPKTQSALLEAMQETQVTVDGETYPLERPVPRDRDAEPGRVRGHVPAPGGAARPLRGADGDRLPTGRRGGPRPRRADHRAAARPAGSGGRPGRTLPPPSSTCGRRSSRRASTATSSPSSTTHGRADCSRWEQARAQASHCSGSPRHAPRVERRDYVLPDDVAAVAVAVLGHRLILSPEARSSGVTPGDLVEEAIAATPVPA